MTSVTARTSLDIVVLEGQFGQWYLERRRNAVLHEIYRAGIVRKKNHFKLSW
jgi:hypothetical protein